jgi:hypothetical protein
MVRMRALSLWLRGMFRLLLIVLLALGLLFNMLRSSTLGSKGEGSL